MALRFGGVSPRNREKGDQALPGLRTADFVGTAIMKPVSSDCLLRLQNRSVNCGSRCASRKNLAEFSSPDDICLPLSHDSNFWEHWVLILFGLAKLQV